MSGLFLTGAEAANYAFTSANTTTANITPKALAVAINDHTKNQGVALLFSGTEYVVTGLVGSETSGVLNLVSGGAPSAAAAGAYAITGNAFTGGTFAANNYLITIQPGALKVIQSVVPPRQEDLLRELVERRPLRQPFGSATMLRYRGHPAIPTETPLAWAHSFEKPLTGENFIAQTFLFNP